MKLIHCRLRKKFGSASELIFLWELRQCVLVSYCIRLHKTQHWYRLESGDSVVTMAMPPLSPNVTGWPRSELCQCYDDWHSGPCKYCEAFPSPSLIPELYKVRTGPWSMDKYYLLTSYPSRHSVSAHININGFILRDGKWQIAIWRIGVAVVRGEECKSGHTGIIAAVKWLQN